VLLVLVEKYGVNTSVLNPQTCIYKIFRAARCGHWHLAAMIVFMASLLRAAGVDPFDESVYRSVLARHTAVPSDVADELGCSPERVVRALDRLREHGLIARRNGRHRRYAAVDPQVAVEALVRTRANELDQIRTAVGELSQLFVAARADGAEQIEIVHGSDALLRWFVRLQQEAREEVLGLDRPPYVEADQNPVEGTALARGVRYRGVYAPEALDGARLREIHDLTRRGERARVLPGLRVKMAIADRRLALLPLTFDMNDVRAAVIRPSALLDALVDFFELCWQQALPLHGDADEIGEDDKALLALMAAGLKDEAIARRLGWSLRTMRRRTSALHTRLGATNRFQAGAIAARRGWL
jgi:DNA-binding MarR family transcriptional regulator/DNA-binding CsgD family transcriptional regulator